ncbi:transposase family protein [Nocardia pseudovaccinii]|uniref:transposase family protein n=1 Tax=Nocardia pseudovaccinii TaxID=189540 RepID=UPI003D93CF0A
MIASSTSASYPESAVPVSSSPIPARGVEMCWEGGASAAFPGVVSLLDLLGEVADPRARWGVRYSARAILAAALAAVVAGARSLTAIGQWVGEASATVLTQLGFEGSVPTENRRSAGSCKPWTLTRWTRRSGNGCGGERRGGRAAEWCPSTASHCVASVW